MIKELILILTLILIFTQEVFSAGWRCAGNYRPPYTVIARDNGTLWRGSGRYGHEQSAYYVDCGDSEHWIMEGKFRYIVDKRRKESNYWMCWLNAKDDLCDANKCDPLGQSFQNCYRYLP